MKFNEIFSKNRAEELPDDLYGKYVLPLGYEDVNLKKNDKSKYSYWGERIWKNDVLKVSLPPDSSKCE